MSKLQSIKQLDGCTLRPPITTEELTTAENVLQHSLPPSLLSVLNESNGLFGEYELGLIWPLERIVRDNIDFWSNQNFKKLYMPFDHLLFFGDAGNGDQFFVPLHHKLLNNEEVYVWNHEDDSRTWVAPSIYKYLDMVA
jgi:cell wall assembly regulator SMI1